MKTMRRHALRKFPVFLCVGIGMALAGCGRDDAANPAADEIAGSHDHAHDHDQQPGHSHDDGHEHEHAEGEHADEHDHATADVVPPGTVPIPPQVRQNLGITFARVERRRVASTMRVPGRFEPLPSAVREYHAPLAGRVELLVNQYDRVSTGTPLYRLDSSEWRRMQQELLTAQAAVKSSSASLMMAMVTAQGGEVAGDITRERVTATDAHIRSLEQSIKVAEEREKQVLRLQKLTGGRLSELNEARTQLATLRTQLTEAKEERAELAQQRLQLATGQSGSAFATTATLQAELIARRAEYESARAQRDLLRASLMSISGQNTTASLDAANGEWQVSPSVTVHASAQGLISELPISSGAYVDAATPILKTVDTSRLRFRAVALQSDVLRLDRTMTGRILRPGSSSSEEGDAIPVTVTMGFEADPEERTLDLVADVPAKFAWARAGLSTDLELVLDDTEDPEMAIPMAAVIQDGLDKIFFRRNPDNLNQAVRVKADLGISDGEWVVVYSGVKAGDQVVLDGVYELKLATADSPAEVGHFHADGTFHEGDH